MPDSDQLALQSTAMDPIRPVMTLPPTVAVDGKRPADPPAVTAEGNRGARDPAVSAARSRAAVSDTSKTDAPADMAETERRGFERDRETQALVYRITDALSGDLVVQIPDEVVVRARAYARQPGTPPGERVVKSI